MKIYNKFFIIITLAYLVTSVCAIFGLISSKASTIVLIALFIPVAIIWVRTLLTLRRIKQHNRHINHSLATQQHQIEADSTILGLEIDNLIVLTQHINNALTELTQLKNQLAHIKQTQVTENETATSHSSKHLIHSSDESGSVQQPISGVITNHVIFNSLIMKSISLSKRKNKILAFMLIDFNSPAKQPFIESIATKISTILRTEDAVAYLDGDIIILLNDIGKPKFAGIVAEKILSTIRQNNDKSQTPAPKTSIGITTFPEDGDTLQLLFDHASEAASRAKCKTDSNYEFYANQTNLEAKEFTQLESALKSAIEHQTLDLYYQPQLEIKSASIVGVEALMRWDHPVFGRVSPDKFITIAEETGSFMKIADITLRHACNMNKQWQANGLEHITVSVNVSPKQFAHPDLPLLITNALRKSDLHPCYLELEISENILMGNIDTSSAILEKIKSTGVGIAIDHFGTGLTAISYLKKFPINAIKIDRGFIAGIPNNPNDLAITNAFISLAHHLGLRVVADGVETAEQVQYLSGQQCDWIQGFFLSHPVHSSKISSQLKKLTNEVDY